MGTLTNENPPTARLLSLTEPGWIEVADARVFLCDALATLSTLREVLTEELGTEAQSEIFFKLGVTAAERLVAGCRAQGYVGNNEEGFRRALSLLTTGGYGQFLVEEAHPEVGWATVSVLSGVEGWATQRSGETRDTPCHYTRGLLAGVMTGLTRYNGHGRREFDAVEMSCIAQGDSECRFLVASPEELAVRGYQHPERDTDPVRQTLARLNRQVEGLLAPAARPVAAPQEPAVASEAAPPVPVSAPVQEPSPTNGAEPAPPHRLRRRPQLRAAKRLRSDE